jgi:hypothetical protein
MFILLSVPVGIVVGVLLGGRIGGLTTLRFRWVWLAIIGFAIQLAIFSDPIGTRVGDAGPAIYVVSNLAVLAAVLRNLAIPGMPIVAIGAACNLAAIVANGGRMPADPGALATAGVEITGATNSVVLASPALAPLTDVMAIPAGVPLANVFSIGDVLIGVGVATVIALAMRRGSSPAAPGTRGSPAA